MIDLLKKLGWSKAELSRRLGLNVSTVHSWKNSAPGYAMAYLELKVRIKRIAEELME